MLYWPNMSADIEMYILACDVCNKLSNNQQKETLISHEIPSRQWETIGTDLFEYAGKDMGYRKRSCQIMVRHFTKLPNWILFNASTSIQKVQALGLA